MPNEEYKPPTRKGGMSSLELMNRLDDVLRQQSTLTATVVRIEKERKEHEDELADQRHDLNDKTAGVISKLSLDVLRGGEKIDVMSRTVAALAEGVEELKGRLVGNPNLLTVGLIQEQSEFRLSTQSQLTDLGRRMSTIESDKVSAKRTWVFTATLFTVLGGIISFLLNLWFKLTSRGGGNTAP